MKNRKPAQSNAARDVSNAILAKRFYEVQKLRNEVLKVELVAAAKHQVARDKHKVVTSNKPPAWSSPQPSHASMRRSTQQNSPPASV